jgi:hypothetical protein
MRWIKPCARTLRNRRRLVSLGADFSIKTGGSFHGFLMRKNRHQWWLPMGIWYDKKVYIIEIYRGMIFIYLKFCLILFRFFTYLLHTYDGTHTQWDATKKMHWKFTNSCCTDQRPCFSVHNWLVVWNIFYFSIYWQK